MRIHSMSDDAIAAGIGARIESLRLKKNLSQAHIAKQAGVSRQTVVNLLHGKSTLTTLIAVLRALGELERMSSLIEEVRPSPIQIVKMAGSLRKRASGVRRTHEVREGTFKSTLIPDASKNKDTDW